MLLLAPLTNEGHRGLEGQVTRLRPQRRTMAEAGFGPSLPDANPHRSPHHSLSRSALPIRAQGQTLPFALRVPIPSAPSLLRN